MPKGCVPAGCACHERSPSPVNRITDACENITLPQTSFAGGNNDVEVTLLYWPCTEKSFTHRHTVVRRLVAVVKTQKRCNDQALDGNQDSPRRLVPYIRYKMTHCRTQLWRETRNILFVYYAQKLGTSHVLL